jgi:hypothetical protein
MLDESQDAIRMHRSLLRVVHRDKDSITVVIPSYDSGMARFTVETGFDVEGDYLLAEVNIGAHKKSDIRFDNFERMPD